MIVLSGAELILPDRILSPGTLIIENGRIAEIRPGAVSGGHPGFAFHGHYIVPGFIDVHVHGIEGVDSLDGAGSIQSMAERLPRYGVTAFCPTTVACAPEPLREVLAQVRRARETPPRGARVLPAHLESNFISQDYRGAQPAACLRLPIAALRDANPSTGADLRVGPGLTALRTAKASAERNALADRGFSATDIVAEIERAAPDVGIVTLAPELDGALELIAWLVSRGHRASLGHSGATYEQALAGITAGARHATHLFNRMPALGHRAPGLAGAILQTDEVAAELICDGVHVHPAMLRTAIAAKRPSRIFAITDGTAAAGLPPGARASLGGQAITVGPDAAYLDDGTLAGSVWTMDRAFQLLVTRVGLSLVDAVTLCATTAARELGLVGHGVLAPDAVADLVVLDAQFNVAQTYVGGHLVYSREHETAV
jgi:N-acetylglucosamine-6-phosphate deacetylase